MASEARDGIGCDPARGERGGGNSCRRAGKKCQRSRCFAVIVARRVERLQPGGVIAATRVVLCASARAPRAIGGSSAGSCRRRPTRSTRRSSAPARRLRRHERAGVEHFADRLSRRSSSALAFRSRRLRGAGRRDSTRRRSR
jgi:hypothetical protein